MSNNSTSSSSTVNTDATTGGSNEFNVSRQKLEPTGNVSIGEFLQIVDKKKIGMVKIRQNFNKVQLQ